MIVLQHPLPLPQKQIRIIIIKENTLINVSIIEVDEDEDGVVVDVSQLKENLLLVLKRREPSIKLVVVKIILQWLILPPLPLLDFIIITMIPLILVILLVVVWVGKV